MKWEHKCSLDWLKKRQYYLTASDVKRLLPVTNTGRKRNVGIEDYMKVMAGKLRVLTEEDCMSYGAAARGHILEPYAIDMLNIELHTRGINETIAWWDDEVIPDGKWERGLAFSPDGLDILPVDFHENGMSPMVMAEVKCYSDERHLATAVTRKERLEERWQIATGMAVCDSIDHAYLVLFDPDLTYGNKGFIFTFDRDDLEEELEIIADIEGSWIEFIHDDWPALLLRRDPMISYCAKSTHDIEMEVEAFRSLNPVV